MRANLSLMVIGFSMLTVPVPLLAHHAFSAEFDAQLPITLRGTITRVERTNPHGWIFVDVKGSDGAVVNWAVETATPQTLARRGLNKNTLPIGMEILVTGFRAKSGSPTINGEDLRLPDGSKLFLGASTGDTPYAKKANEADQAGERAPR